MEVGFQVGGGCGKKWGRNQGPEYYFLRRCDLISEREEEGGRDPATRPPTTLNPRRKVRTSVESGGLCSGAVGGRGTVLWSREILYRRGRGGTRPPSHQRPSTPDTRVVPDRREGPVWQRLS